MFADDDDDHDDGDAVVEGVQLLMLLLLLLLFTRPKTGTFCRVESTSSHYLVSPVVWGCGIEMIVSRGFLTELTTLEFQPVDV